MTTTHARPAAGRPDRTAGPQKPSGDGTGTRHGPARDAADGPAHRTAREPARDRPDGQAVDPACAPPRDPGQESAGGPEDGPDPAHRDPHSVPRLPAARPGRRPRGRTAPPNRRDTRRPGPPPAYRPPGDPRPHEWFAERLVLVLSGRRPMHWLLGHTVGIAYDQLAAFADDPPLRHGRRPELRACGYCRPAPDAIEAFARVAVGDRLRALAFRLELGPDRRWRCAAVEMDPSPRHGPA